jgi:hypothetical protein
MSHELNMKHVARIEKVLQGKMGEIVLRALKTGKIELRLSFHGNSPDRKYGPMETRRKWRWPKPDYNPSVRIIKLSTKTILRLRSNIAARNRSKAKRRAGHARRSL